MKIIKNLFWYGMTWLMLMFVPLQTMQQPSGMPKQEYNEMRQQVEQHVISDISSPPSSVIQEQEKNQQIVEQKRPLWKTVAKWSGITVLVGWTCILAGTVMEKFEYFKKKDKNKK